MNKIRSSNKTALTVLCSTLLLGACGSSKTSDDYSEGVPELAAVQMKITAERS